MNHQSDIPGRNKFNQTIRKMMENGYKYQLSLDNPSQAINKWELLDLEDYELSGQLFTIHSKDLGDCLIAVFMLGTIQRECLIFTKYVLSVNRDSKSTKSRE